jgi:hypothetical protein
MILGHRRAPCVCFCHASDDLLGRDGLWNEPKDGDGDNKASQDCQQRHWTTREMERDRDSKEMK